MDSFEGLISTLLEAEGYWTRRSFKVNVTKDEKKAIGNHSIPRPEIDVLAMSHARNEVIAMEVKSYLDSPGLRPEELQASHVKPEGRYKLFTSANYRGIVLARLHQDLIDCGMADAKTNIRLGLAMGKVYQGRTADVRQHLDAQKFIFWSPEDIKEKVTALAKRDYENDPAIMVAKVLLR